MSNLRKHGRVTSNSKLLPLNPYIDQEGLRRVGGRFNNATGMEEMKHPMIIPYDSHLTHLLIDQAHQMTFHGGPRLTLSHLRQKYWIIGGMRVTKMQVRRYVTCRKISPTKQHQIMGELPSARINPAPPFYHTGVDYTGFVEVMMNKGRGAKTTEHQQTARTSKINFIGLVMTLLYLLNPASATTNTTNFIELQQGLYFDKATDMKLIRDEWKIVAYYDVKPYWHGTAVFTKFNDHLENICSTLNQKTQCDIIALQLRHAFGELEHYNRLLLNPQGRVNIRSKRGFINGVGSIARSLFGVLDDQFAEQYQQDIELIQENEKHLALLLKNQTTIIEAEYNILRRSEETIEKQYKLFNQHLINLDKLTSNLQQKIESQELSIEFVTWTTRHLTSQMTTV